MTDTLRTALHDLGDVPPPPDLADRALDRARRDRRRTGVALAAVAAVATAAAVVVPLSLRTGAAPPATPPPAPAVWVSGYLAVTGNGAEPVYQAHVYDPAARDFRVVPVTEARLVALSPDGSQAVVAPPGSGQEGMVVVGLDRLIAGLTEADWQQPRLPLAGSWTWSPDGTRLLAGYAAYRPTRATVVDVRTRAVTEVPLQLDELRAADHGLTWGPGGRGFLTWRSTLDERRPGRGEVAVYDEGGRPTRRYPMPALADQVWLSPDGNRALVVSRMPDPPSRPNDQSWVLDLRTGATTSPVLSPDGWYDDGHLVRVDIPQRGNPTIAVLQPERERVIRRSALVLPARTALIRVLLARGTPPPGAIVL